MNRTRTSKNAKRLLVWLLLLTMVFGLLPMAAFADEAGEPVVSEEPVQEPEPSSEPSAEPSQEPEEDPMDEPSDEESTDEEPVDEEEEVVVARYTGNDGFLRIFHLDCGRKYFSVSEIEGIIDQLAENHYTHIQLAFGNDGFRFLLNDMKVTLDDGTVVYTDSAVRTAITEGNSAYSNSIGTDITMLSESDMDSAPTRRPRRMRFTSAWPTTCPPRPTLPPAASAPIAGAPARSGTRCRIMCSASPTP